MDGILLICLLLPVVGVCTAFFAGGRLCRPIALAFLVGGLIVAALVLDSVWSRQSALVYASGHWMPPVGIVLRADGLSAVMLAMVALTAMLVALAAPGRPGSAGEPDHELPPGFWLLLLGVCSALNAVCLGADFFNLYVALELVAFAGVPLVCLKSSPETLNAALRYLIFALCGSAIYLLGAVILYGDHATLDIGLLAEQVRPGIALSVALSAITIGLAAKTALFPLHFWLPPAHAGALPAASALLSALVVKGSFFLIVRVWFDFVPWLLDSGGGRLLGLLGALAIVWGGVMALRQDRLKLLIAYSTVSQIGYLFLIFPVGATTGALGAGMLQAVSHAMAKAAMFLAAGILAEIAGTDKLTNLRGAGRAVPLTTFALGLAALSLVGVPPTGGFAAKWGLLAAAISSGQWLWALPILAGGLLAGGYMFRAVMPVLSPGDGSPAASVPLGRQLAVLALAAGALLAGPASREILQLVSIGRPSLQGVLP